MSKQDVEAKIDDLATRMDTLVKSVSHLIQAVNIMAELPQSEEAGPSPAGPQPPEVMYR